jgi:di/tricarboxylate transporter
MTYDQLATLGILLATMLLFLWGRWRHDMVALAALLAAVAVGIVPAGEAFAGFGHPAVITVACVLVLSHGLQRSGAVDLLARRYLPNAAGAAATVVALTAVGALLSAFMNNVAALALLMPIAIQRARKLDIAPGQVLMPVAFGSILGGMTTLIGTPPNLIVASFRAQVAEGRAFGMFDFTPVGLAVAVVGIAFVAVVGWRLVPRRKGAGAEGFDIGAYLTEVRVPKGAKSAGMSLREIETALGEADVQIIGLVRKGVRLSSPSPLRIVEADDILLVEAEPEALGAALPPLGLMLEQAAEAAEAMEDASDEARDQDKAAADERRDALVLSELAVLPSAPLVGRTVGDIHLRTRFGVNLLAVSRQGRRSMRRLREMPLWPGDVLLMQGPAESLAELAKELGCVPLAERPLYLPRRRDVRLATAIMLGAVAAAALGLASAAVAFAGGVLAAMATRVVPPRSVYAAIDWPVIVLLGALLPVAGAMATTGTAELLAQSLLGTIARGHAVVALALLLVVTMTLSDFVNNAATAAVMCPIALGTAAGLGASPEPFLMAVAVGASCAFLTPIGHQNNTLILGPGGFRFGDYWRLGLPLEILVVAVAVPMILLVWPLGAGAN